MVVRVALVFGRDGAASVLMRLGLGTTSMVTTEWSTDLARLNDLTAYELRVSTTGTCATRLLLSFRTFIIIRDYLLIVLPR